MWVKWFKKKNKPVIVSAKCEHKNAKWCWLAQRVALIKCSDCGFETTVDNPDKWFDKNRKT